MIIEGILTSTTPDGRPHLAPMGPVVTESLDEWVLRPFQTSSTFHNLRNFGFCVFHVVDNVLLVTKSALSMPVDLTYSKSPKGGWIIDSACHWYFLETREWNLSSDRAEVTARVVEQGMLRPFWGWNRAKHAVLEATILVTRLHLTGYQYVLQEMKRLEPVLEKTAGTNERTAWDLLYRFIEDHRSSDINASQR